MIGFRARGVARMPAHQRGKRCEASAGKMAQARRRDADSPDNSNLRNHDMSAFSQSTMALCAAAAMATLVGCGGGGDAAASGPIALKATPASGTAIDGYLSGATVFCDLNGNNTLDAGEASTTTDAKGHFTFAAGCDATMVAFGGKNADTGFDFTGIVKAPKGSAYVTPMTSLLGTLNAAQLAALTGAPAGTDFTTIDIADGQHQDLLKRTLAVQQLIADTTKLITAANGSTDVRSQYSRVVDALAKTLAAVPSGTSLLGTGGSTNTALLAGFVKSLPDVAILKFSAADLDAVANVISANAQSLAQATDGSLAALQQTLQDPAKPSSGVTAAKDFLALSNDALVVNGLSSSLTQFGNGVATSDLSTIGFTLAVAGSPAADVTTSVALELVERGGKGRKLQLMLDKVHLTLDAKMQLAINVPVGAKVYAYGHTANGTDVNLTIGDLAFAPITVTQNGFTLNYDNMVKKVLASAGNSSGVTAAQFVGITGTFDVKVVMAGVNLRHSDGSAFSNQTVSLTNTQQSVTGAGFSGALTIH